jgi:hypothetical protein
VRAGDVVKHGPTGETWLVAYVQGDHMAWSGWPEGEALTSDCTLIEACDDAEHEAALRSWADEPHYRDNGELDLRHRVCKRQLEALLEGRVQVSP